MLDISKEEAETLMTKAYSLMLFTIKSKFSKMKADIEDNSKPKNYYLPYLGEDSKIVASQDFELIW